MMVNNRIHPFGWKKGGSKFFALRMGAFKPTQVFLAADSIIPGKIYEQIFHFRHTGNKFWQFKWWVNGIRQATPDSAALTEKTEIESWF